MLSFSVGIMKGEREKEVPREKLDLRERRGECGRTESRRQSLSCSGQLSLKIQKDQNFISNTTIIVIGETCSSSS